MSGSENYIGSCYFGPGTTNGYIINFRKKAGREMKANTLADSYFKAGDLPKSVLIDSEESEAMSSGNLYSEKCLPLPGSRPDPC